VARTARGVFEAGRIYDCLGLDAEVGLWQTFLGLEVAVDEALFDPSTAT
jgi:hypothetical protein